MINTGLRQAQHTRVLSGAQPRSNAVRPNFATLKGQMEKSIRKPAKLLLCAAAAITLQAQDPKETGPTSLAITYHCHPDKRSDLRNSMREDGLPLFEGYRRDAILADYRILMSRYVDTNNWDMLLLLRFSDYTAVERWKLIEQDSPAGLPPKVVGMATSMSTYPLDLMRRKAIEDTPRQPVYLLIPYTYSVTAPAYLQYVDDYVTPQFDGWIDEGVLVTYEIYTQRYSAARPFDAFFLLEYKDDESLGQREKVVAKVRQRLQANPKWKAAADSKQTIRVEKEAIIADELTPPQ